MPDWHIPPPEHPTYDIEKVVRDALAEDAGDLGDVTTLATIPSDTQARAEFLAKDTGILAGVGVADLVFRLVDPELKVEWKAKDGDRVQNGQKFGFVQGSARSILVAERVALNFMQRMSGIATATAAMVAACNGHSAKVLETRKTAPGLRVFDKWAVLIGGGSNHRMGLYDMMMIKDNHIAASGGITAAILRAEEYIASTKAQGMQVEVETRTLEEVQEVLDVLRSGRGPHVHRIMLDNMTRPAPEGSTAVIDVGLLQAAVKLVNGVVETEASGNVNLRTIGAIAAAGVSHVSVGNLTHSVAALDISLKIKTEHKEAGRVPA